jgi:hypothetical protein
MNAWRQRASERKIPFDLTEEYVAALSIPDLCPILGIPLDPDADKEDANSVQLDRIKPQLGYVQGNVRWVSRRGNSVKGNYTALELRMAAEDVERWNGVQQTITFGESHNAGNPE